MYVFQVNKLMEMSLTYFLAFPIFKLLSLVVIFIFGIIWFETKKKLYDVWLNFTDNHEINWGLFVLKAAKFKDENQVLSLTKRS